MTYFGHKIRALVLTLGIARQAAFVWSFIYPHTALYKKRNTALTRLLSEFIKPGDLVFDVGANKGLYTRLFLRMGVRKVIAVEPDERIAKKLIHPQVKVEQQALGSHLYVTNYYPGNTDSTSTLSLEFMRLPRWSTYKWGKPVKIFVTTLDYLKMRYGDPDFIKIDVEGYEVEVLRGMSFPPKALSFEFLPEDMQSVGYCIKIIDSLGTYQYTYTVGLEPDMQFIVPWGGAEYMIDHIITHVPEDAFGDIWARREY